MMASSAVRVPIVVVLGATGAGKSKLALEIAQKYGGEVISADAMQMYKGLDIVTNKVTPEEMRSVKHHMIDFLDPMLQSTVVDFRNQAVPIIDELLQKKVMPVICGGTNYYIESLLWNVLADSSPSDSSTIEPIDKISKDDTNDNITTKDLYEKLKDIDPERAEHLHPNERRKILRSLQIFQRQGKKHSQILEDQKKEAGGGLLGGGLRYPEDQLALLWVQCEQKTLDERCDKRVDKMIAQGLLNELKAFHKEYNRKRGNVIEADYTLGIFQSIGFKEFHDFLMLDCAEQENEKGQVLFKKAKDQMMLVTRQYARRQTKWIRQRFLRDHGDRQCPPVYGFSSDDPTQWESVVQRPAFQLIEAFIQGQPLTIQPLTKDIRTYSYEETRQSFHCDICDITLKGCLQNDLHLKGQKHKRMLARQRRNQAFSVSASDMQMMTLRLKVDDKLVQKIDENSESNEDERRLRISFMRCLREVTGVPLQNIRNALQDVNENVIELQWRHTKDDNVEDILGLLKQKLDDHPFILEMDLFAGPKKEPIVASNEQLPLSSRPSS